MQQIVVGDLIIYPERKRVEVAGQRVPFDGRQWQFLHAVSECAGTLVTKRYLLDYLYPDPAARPNFQALDMLAFRIRTKLQDALPGASYLHTIDRLGYVLQAPQ